MSLPRVVFLSAPPHGEEMLVFLRTLPCEIVYCSINDQPPHDYGHFDYDLGLNFLGTRKIPASEVNRPKRGWVNFHPAPLPEYGGRNVAFHALENYEERFGATVHYMEEEFDAGPILAVQSFLIESSWTAGDLMNEAVKMLKDLFRAWVPVLLQFDGKLPATPQDLSRREYFKKGPIDDEVELDSDQLRAVRARTFHPKHHARVVVGGKRYKIVPEV